MGAQRCLTASSNIFPEIMVGIYDVFKRGDFEEAMIMQNSIYVLVRTKIFEGSRGSIRSMATLTLFSLQKLSNEQS
jgi:dihydrodipicolinate synthase/N-acetylneuraminate lyase